MTICGLSSWMLWPVSSTSMSVPRLDSAANSLKPSLMAASVVAAADWGAEHAPSTDAPREWIELVRSRRDDLVPLIRETVRDGGSIFVGEGSVVSRLPG
jgi:hypothetical protein